MSTPTPCSRGQSDGLSVPGATYSTTDHQPPHIILMVHTEKQPGEPESERLNRGEGVDTNHEKAYSNMVPKIPCVFDFNFPRTVVEKL